MRGLQSFTLYKTQIVIVRTYLPRIGGTGKHSIANNGKPIRHQTHLACQKSHGQITHRRRARFIETGPEDECAEDDLFHRLQICEKL